MASEPQTFADLQDAGCAQSQLVLQAIARHANWDTGVCFPSLREIARMAKCSIPTARRHLHKLRDDGFVALGAGRRNDGGQSSNTITLVGYADWIAAVRSGGIVAKPRRSQRYVESDLGHDTDPVLGQENAARTHAENDTPPLKMRATPPPLNLIGGPSQQVIGAPSQQVIGAYELHLNPHINSHPPAPEVGACDTAGEGKYSTPSQGRAGIDTRGWHRKWDDAARNAIQDLLGDPFRAHVATNLLIPLVGTLAPPAGVHGASYVRDLAGVVRQWPAEVLADVAEAIRADRVRDLPSPAQARKLCKAVAHAMAAGTARPGASAVAPDIDGWVEGLLHGDPACPRVALLRALVGRLGAASSHAWFAEAVVTRDADRVMVALPRMASWVATRMETDVLIAAKAVWPGVTRVRICDRPTPQPAEHGATA